MYGFDGARVGNYFGGKPVRRTEVTMKKLKNGKGADNDEIKREIIKRKLCNMVLRVV